MSGRKRDRGTIVIKKNEIVEGGHHGGAWKVAYADFVTAMMAFFLLMWLLNATTQEQKRGLADYFAPTAHVITSPSGSGAPLGGKTPNSDGAMVSDRGAVDLTRTQPFPVVDEDDTGDMPTQEQVSTQPGTAPRPSASEGGARAGKMEAGQAQSGQLQSGQQRAGNTGTNTRAPTDREVRAEAERQEKQAFERAATQIRDVVGSDPALADVAKQLSIDITPQGLRIQLLDADRTPMFSTGSAALNDRARALLAKIAPVLIKMPEGVAISGHTDATPYRGGDKTNWDLSADRANATRRLLTDAGVPESRLRSVTGNADRDPLIADDPFNPANRRISIVLLRDRAVAKK